MAKSGTLLLPVVAAAMVDGSGRVLLQRRPAGTSLAGSWEFPGGKLETGETPEAALARELREELDVDVEEAAMRPVCFASAPLGGRRLLLLLYLVERWAGEPRTLAADALAWIRPADMRALVMPPADLPLIDALAAAIRARKAGMEDEA